MEEKQIFLRILDVHKSFLEGENRRVVLQGANAEFFEGETVAILGKSGSGKTTLLNLISGIDQVESGSISLYGTDLTRLNENDRTLFRRKNIGFIFQFFNLIPTLTVWENILLPLELNGSAGKTGLARANELLTEVGLSDRKRAFPDRLSGGEQQRVAIARALVHDPSLLLADEPTGNLDDENGKVILSLLDRLTRRVGKNMIMVTHNIEAAAITNRILTMREGHLVE
jgi:putative ABC transport system ATP-binding protein